MKEEEEELSDYLFSLMHNYSDSTIPSFAHLNPTPNIKQEPKEEENPYSKQISLNECSSSRKKPRVDQSESCREKARRSSMNKSYETLQSLLPEIASKAPKTAIVTAAIEFINRLKKVEKELEARKKEVEIAARGTYKSQSPNIQVVVSGEMAFFGIYLEVGRGLVAKILMAFEDMKNVEVLSANVAVDSGGIKLTVTAMVSGNGKDVVRMIKGEIQRLLSS